ncbi:bleomycin resistance protein [Chitinophaga parva]|uniref:Bleomycin resistance protein n=1 Tax=Chitinophaga parva TaxID=2169414 RepID=A0A2T7BP09_9BACT|nr:glyoxalase superfamily protein [Chitinophaga parva]PUZ29406.1 bleomycin resistance protein [Chitinophaga parva]
METAHDNVNITQAVPMFMVISMERSLVFYVEGLGFTIKNTWLPRGVIEWCWLEREGVALMLQEYRGDHPHIHAEKGVGIGIWFQCRDALALYKEFLSKGIKAEEPFVGNQMWDVRVIDPDGYILHFESPTDVPEETKFSDWTEQTQ